MNTPTDKAKAEPGNKGKAALVRLDPAVKEQIDGIASSTGHSVDEILHLLLTYALPRCKIANPATTPIKAAAQKTAAKLPEKPAPAAGAKPPAKAADSHAAVPTFRLPPIQKK